MSKKIKFSIIVPVYNVSAYLLKCLDSINSQKFKDFECLVIDDGSTDDSGVIAVEFCNQHDNFYYYKKLNGGLSDARNFGLERSTSDFVVFIDSDDFVSQNLLLYVNEAIKEYNADLVYFQFERFINENDVEDRLTTDIKPTEISNKILSRYPNFAWLRVAKRTLYQDNLFPKGVIYEDAVTTPILTARAQKIVELDNVLCFYRRRVGSITTASAINQFRLYEALDILKERCQELDIPEVYYHTAFVNLSKSVIVSLARIKTHNEFYAYLIRSWQEFDKLTYKDGLTSNAFLKSKILFIILKIKWLGLPFYYGIKILLKLVNK